jgi:alpha-beta hydrolase superfamily lysophospholipase
MLPRAKRLLIAAAIGLLIGLPAASCLVAEGALHIWNRPKPEPRVAQNAAESADATWEPVEIGAADGAPLSAWIFTPRHPNGAAVILLHGVSDTRAGSLAVADFLLCSGFTVLTPDARGHGASGGDVISYGIRETADVHAWADWLVAHRPVERLYGWGASMGAAILLQSLPVEPRFRALVADSPFATFDEVAHDRLAQHTGIWPPAFWPVVHLGFGYARLRYGLDLQHAAPIDIVRATNVPILLIHGTNDRNIPPRHSRELHAANPRTVLWEVPRAGHVQSFASDPQEYARRVIGWFEAH